MPEMRDQLRARESHDHTVSSGTHKAAILSLLVSNKDEGYTPSEIAAETPVPAQSVYKVLQRLREDELAVKMSGHYLINEDHATEIKDMVLSSQQHDVAKDISDANTAPDDVEPTSPEDLEEPTEEPLL